MDHVEPLMSIAAWSFTNTVFFLETTWLKWTVSYWVMWADSWVLLFVKLAGVWQKPAGDITPLQNNNKREYL